MNKLGIILLLATIVIVLAVSMLGLVTKKDE